MRFCAGRWEVAARTRYHFVIVLSVAFYDQLLRCSSTCSTLAYGRCFYNQSPIERSWFVSKRDILVEKVHHSVTIDVACSTLEESELNRTGASRRSLLRVPGDVVVLLHSSLSLRERKMQILVREEGGKPKCTHDLAFLLKNGFFEFSRLLRGFRG